jgi:hypothetical protein
MGMLRDGQHVAVVPRIAIGMQFDVFQSAQ